MTEIDSQRQKQLARSLRRSQSDAERRLWLRLRGGQLMRVKFRRQQPIGHYIVDFVSFERSLVIEVDGGQHNQEKNVESDRERTLFLQGRGYRVIRFWNNDVLGNLDGVVQAITDIIEHT